MVPSLGILFINRLKKKRFVLLPFLIVPISYIVLTLLGRRILKMDGRNLPYRSATMNLQEKVIKRLHLIRQVTRHPVKRTCKDLYLSSTFRFAWQQLLFNVGTHTLDSKISRNIVTLIVPATFTGQTTFPQTTVIGIAKEEEVVTRGPEEEA